TRSADLAGDGVVGIRANDLRARIGEVHGRAVGAPAQAVRRADAVELGDAAALRIDAIQRARRRARLIVHGADPEAALTVALAVVETHLGATGFGCCDRLELAGGRIEQRDRRFQCEQQSTSFAHRQRADHFRQRPAVDARGPPVVSAHQTTADINPVERLLLHVPHRAFAQYIDGVANAAPVAHVDLLPKSVRSVYSRS